MIDGKTLLFINANGDTQQRCAGSAAGCRDVVTIVESTNIITVPYICHLCWRKGWRNRLDMAYAPGEDF
ncbi:MAG: hypothetical protein ABI790_02465 [Betaproteobacteria bacterium]